MENDHHKSDRNIAYEAIDRLLAWLEESRSFPGKDRIRREAKQLKEMIMDNRPPRLMVVGRRGSGKSSLINAIFQERVAKTGAVYSQTGRPEWFSYQSSHGTLELLDTRGFGDATKPDSAEYEDAVQELKAACDKKQPDAAIFLCRAKDVDSRISDDVKALISIRAHLNKKYRYQPPALGVVTQVDELDPRRINKPPYDDDAKQRNIRDATDQMQGAALKGGLPLMTVVPTSAYAEYKGDRLVDDAIWNVDHLVEYLVQELPNEAQMQFARLSRRQAARIAPARTIVGSTATICAGMAATPIPIGDIFPITATQIGMITSIAYLGGRTLSRDSAKEFMVAMGANVGTAFVLREGARALAKVAFPGAGHAVSATVAFAATWGIGEAAIAYFIKGSTAEEAKRIYRNERERREEADD